MATFQLSVAVRDGRNNSIENTIGVTPILRMRTGALPANCAAANSGTVVATLNLPSDWLATSAIGTIAKLGTWEDLSADAAGTIGHFRIHNAGDTVCHAQGDVTITGGGGAMTVDNPVVEAGQKITVSSFAITDGNA
jgi:hypothetical protein